MKFMTLRSSWQSSLLCLLLSYSAQGMGSIYKWVDENGNVHYGSQRPAESSAEKMSVDMHAPQDTSTYNRPGQKDKTAPADGAEGETAEKEKAEDEEKKPMTAAEKKKLQAACQQARKQLATMQAKGQIRVRDKDGSTSYLSQEQKDSRIKQLRDAVAKKCK